MDALKKLELKLDEVLRQKAPFQIPPNGRKGLADAMWIIALVVGILQLLVAWGFWQAGQRIDRAVDSINYLSRVYGGTEADASGLGLFFYLTLVLMAVEAVILLMAVPKLKERLKSGWNLLFYVALAHVVLGVARLFSDVDGGVTGLFGTLIGAVVGGYLLFQVREYFNGVTSANSAVKAEKTTEKAPAPAAQKEAAKEKKVA